MDVDEIVKNVLAHHGVKGQKWGVRRAEKKTAKIDARFEKRPTNPKHILSDRIALHNSVHDIMNYHIGRINSKPEYVKAANDGILADDNHPTTKKYLKEYMDTYVSELNKSAKNMGMNASGTREFGVRAANDFLGFQIYARDVKHASENSFDIKFVRDDKGRVMDLILDSIAQGVLAVDNVLAHHGVKGMRWGVTRSKGSSPQAVTTDVKRVRG